MGAENAAVAFACIFERRATSTRQVAICEISHEKRGVESSDLGRC
jgi:hypothetical protein